MSNVRKQCTALTTQSITRRKENRFLLRSFRVQRNSVVSPVPKVCENVTCGNVSRSCNPPFKTLPNNLTKYINPPSPGGNCNGGNDVMNTDEFWRNDFPVRSAKWNGFKPSRRGADERHVEDGSQEYPWRDNLRGWDLEHQIVKSGRKRLLDARREGKRALVINRILARAVCFRA